MAIKVKPGTQSGIPDVDEDADEVEAKSAGPASATETLADFPTELTAGEQTELTNKAREQVRKELKTAAREAYKEAELKRLRAEAGIGKMNGGGVVSGSPLSEMVTFTLDLPDNGTEYIHLDMPIGKKFHRGHQYTMPRHVFNELIWIAYMQQRLERSIKGEKQWGFREKPFSVQLSARDLSRQAVN